MRPWKKRRPLAELAEKFALHPNKISQWKQEFIAGCEQVFDTGKGKTASGFDAITANEADLQQLYATIGQLQMERDFLKKLSQMGSPQVRRSGLEAQASLSIRRQCDLLSVSRGNVYYAPKGENEQNLAMMRLMDAHILEEPTAGVLTMQSMLRDEGYHAATNGGVD